MTKFLILLNDPPYGTERSYNGLRLASTLSKREGAEVRIFLMGDAIGCAKASQKTPSGYYNLERMVKGLVRTKVTIGTCGSCLDARGVTEAELAQGVHRSSMEELTEWSVWADKVIVF